MNDPNHYRQIIKELQGMAREKELYLICRLQQSESQAVEVIDQKINEVSSSQGKGLGLHLFDQEGHSLLASTDNIDDQEAVRQTLVWAATGLEEARGKGFSTNRQIFQLNSQKASLSPGDWPPEQKLTTIEVGQELQKINRKIAKIGQQLGTGNRLKIHTYFRIGRSSWWVTRRQREESG